MSGLSAIASLCGSRRWVPIKTRTAAFDLAWGNKRVRKGIYKITYKRRYWNGSAYALESTAKTLKRREIDRIGGLRWALDTPFQNRILASNVSLALKDNGYKWLPTNTASGIWRKDAGSPTYGYEPVGSEFVIHYGYVLADDTEEYLAMFTGLVDDDPKFDSKSGVAIFSLTGKAESMLSGGDAQKVGTVVTDGATTPATGDGSNLRFATQTSIWAINTVRVNAVAKVQGTDYTLDKLNDAEDEADIVFESGSVPGGGLTLLYNGNRWLRDKSVKELIEALCDQVSIGSGSRSIEEPIFAAVDQSRVWDTEAQWALGSVLTNTDTAGLTGTLRRKWHKIDDFGDGDYTLDPVWTVTAGAPTINAGQLRLTGGGFNIGLGTPSPQGSAYGTWEWKWTASAATAQSVVEFIYGPGSRQYSLIYNHTGTNLSLSKAGSTLGVASTSDDFTTQKTVRVTRSAAGVFNVYVGGVLRITATDTTYTAAYQFGVANDGGTGTQDFDDIYWSPSVNASGAVDNSQMVWTSEEIDLLAAPTAWLPITVSQTLNGGTVTLSTNVATVSGGPYDGAVAADGTNTPTSALKRYLKLTIETTKSGYNAPEFASVTVNWRGTSLFIKSADFTGLNCLQAVQELAKFSSMEFGTEGDGTFFFRNKNVSGSADITLNQKNALIEIMDYSTGYRDVKNIFQVRYGKSGTDGYYFSEYKASDASEASPTTAERFGSKVLALDLTRFIFSNNANVAGAIARKGYEFNYRPKRRIKARARIIPQLDLSDKGAISFHDSPLIESNIFGDPFQKGFPPAGPNPKTLARSILMKVVGHSPDVMKGESVLDLEEIL